MTVAVEERGGGIVIPHHASAARAARRRFADELADVVTPAMLADAVAVVAELLGNSVRHAGPLPGGVIQLSWQVGPAIPVGVYLRVTVIDGGAERSPTPRTVGPESIDGRGLVIVAALAQRWGVEAGSSGQCVWAELGTPRH